MTLPFIIMALVTIQRLGELVVAASNTGHQIARGAIEYGRAHYPAMVTLHASWLLVLWLTVGARDVNLPLLGVFLALQAVRLWVLSALGRHWTTRIIVLPNTPLITGGPYRYSRHPNYCVVVAEIAILPLVFGLVWVAVVFSLLNAAMLWVRIRAETQALLAAESSIA